MRMLHAVAAAGFLIGVSAAQGAAAAPAVGDMTLGKANAPVTIIEYASPTCPVCKAWHDQVLPAVKSKYVATGKVKFIFREMPSHNPPMDVAIFLLGRCAGAAKYFSVVDDAYARRDEIEALSTAGNSKDALDGMGKKVGLAPAQVAACVKDDAGIQRIIEGAQAAMRDLKVSGTPTIFVGDEMIEDPSVETISAKVDEKLKPAGK